MQDPHPLSRALLSVSDKTGLAELGAALAARGVELLSTGGTAAALRGAGLSVRDVAEVTGFPELMDGRVKTLHPAIHAGLLARPGHAGDAAALAAHGIGEIGLLVVNLYPFEAARAAGADEARMIETIDVGGPAMIRAAAKTHGRVAVLTDPADYPALLAEVAATGGTTAALRRRLAAAAFARTAAYDAAIADWFAGDDPAPRRVTLSGSLLQPLRYGENPHQRAAFYRDGSARPGVATARAEGGKELSYNNIADADAAFELVAEFDPAAGPACAIVKHANPCGVATGPTLAEAWARAHDGDRVSAFGGVVATNVPLDGAAARAIASIFTEVVIAPGADDEARAVLAGRPNLRLLLAGGLPDPARPGRVWKQVAGGFLLQDRDGGPAALPELSTVTARAPQAAELADLLFAWRVVRHVKSNAIVLAKGGATVGIGAGQMSRVDSTRLAVAKAAEAGAALGLAESPARGAVLASDAFFPFPDGIEAAAAAGVRAIIQPGGAQRDAAVIAAADAAGIAMVFTRRRHFRH